MAYEVILKKKTRNCDSSIGKPQLENSQKGESSLNFSKCSMKETWLLSSYLRNHKDIYLTLDESTGFFNMFLFKYHLFMACQWCIFGYINTEITKWFDE